jgi:hypothetical protein
MTSSLCFLLNQQSASSKSALSLRYFWHGYVRRHCKLPLISHLYIKRDLYIVFITQFYLYHVLLYYYLNQSFYFTSPTYDYSFSNNSMYAFGNEL